MSMSPDRGLVEDRSSSARVRARLGRHVAVAAPRRAGPPGRGGRPRPARADLRVGPGLALAPAAPGASRARRGAVFVVGVQRSGTNMVAARLRAGPRGRGAQRERPPDLRAVPAPRRRRRPRRHPRAAGTSSVLFKPLCDSHRTGGDPRRPRRRRAPTPGRSGSTAASTAGPGPRSASSATSTAGCSPRSPRDVAWTAGRRSGLSEESLDLIRSIGPETLDPESAAALFWLVRNRLYLEQGLDHRRDVHLVCYERVVADPEPEIDALARFLGVEPSPQRYAHIDRRVGVRRPARPAPAGPGAPASSSRPRSPRSPSQCHRRVTEAAELSMSASEGDKGTASSSGSRSSAAAWPRSPSPPGCCSTSSRRPSSAPAATPTRSSPPPASRSR